MANEFSDANPQGGAPAQGSPAPSGGEPTRSAEKPQISGDESVPWNNDPRFQEWHGYQKGARDRGLDLRKLNEDGKFWDRFAEYERKAREYEGLDLDALGTERARALIAESLRNPEELKQIAAFLRERHPELLASPNGKAPEPELDDDLKPHLAPFFEKFEGRFKTTDQKIAEITDFIRRAMATGESEKTSARLEAEASRSLDAFTASDFFKDPDRGEIRTQLFNREMLAQHGDAEQLEPWMMEEAERAVRKWEDRYINSLVEKRERSNKRATTSPGTAAAAAPNAKKFGDTEEEDIAIATAALRGRLAGSAET